MQEYAAGKTASKKAVPVLVLSVPWRWWCEEKKARRSRRLLWMLSFPIISLTKAGRISHIMDRTNVASHPTNDGTCAGLEAQLATMDVQIAALQAQRAILEQALNEQRSCNSRLSIIPTEVLQSIFLETLPRNRLPNLVPSQPPVLLTHVCRRWRQVAVSFPELWSKMHIPLMSQAALDNPSIVLALEKRAVFQVFCASLNKIMGSRKTSVQTFLDRAGNAPLDISLTWTFPQLPCQPPPLNNTEDRMTISPHNQHAFDILRLLAARKSQWRSIWIEAHAPNNQFLGYLPPGDFPTLTRLSIIDAGYIPEHTLTRLLGEIVVAAPRLLHLDLPDLRRIEDLQAIDMSRLTTLRIQTLLQTHEIMNLIGRCQALRTFSFARRFPAPSDAATTPSHQQIVFPFLEQLAWRDECLPHVAEIAPNIDMPSLTALSILMSAKPVLAFLAQHGQKLRQLSLNCRFLKEADVLKALELVPNAEGIRLRDSGSQYQGSTLEAVLTFLTLSSRPSRPICPRLRRLSIHCTNPPFSQGQLLDFIISRSVQQPGILHTRLKYFELCTLASFPFSMDSEDDERPQRIHLKVLESLHSRWRSNDSGYGEQGNTLNLDGLVTKLPFWPLSPQLGAGAWISRTAMGTVEEIFDF